MLRLRVALTYTHCSKGGDQQNLEHSEGRHREHKICDCLGGGGEICKELPAGWDTSHGTRGRAEWEGHGVALKALGALGIYRSIKAGIASIVGEMRCYIIYCRVNGCCGTSVWEP